MTEQKTILNHYRQQSVLMPRLWLTGKVTNNQRRKRQKMINLKIEVGKYYRAKKPVKCLDGGFNDRAIIWISEDGAKIQYDGYSVGTGRHYPIVSLEMFLRWAGKEITKDEYMNTSCEKR